jgi:AraC-like DNA-binding protein
MDSAVTLPGSWALALIELLTEKGFSLQQIIVDSIIDVKELSKKDARISYQQFHQLEQNALSLTGDAGLGLELGARSRISHFGMLGYAVVSAKNISRAIELGSRYFSLFNTVIDFKYNLEAPQASTEAFSRIALGSMERFAFELAISCIYTIGRFLVEKPIAPDHISFTFSEPEYADDYYRFFGCPILFEAPANAIFYDSKYLASPLKLADSEVTEVCQQQCERWLQGTAEEEKLITEVRREILRNPGTFPSIGTVSTSLNTSPRTLSRRLAGNACSYGQLLNESRRDIAIDYLRDTQLSVEDIAELVDYSDAANFRKAFKKWTGRRPIDYRPR